MWVLDLSLIGIKICKVLNPENSKQPKGFEILLKSTPWAILKYNFGLKKKHSQLDNFYFSMLWFKTKL